MKQYFKGKHKTKICLCTDFVVQLHVFDMKIVEHMMECVRIRACARVCTIPGQSVVVSRGAVTSAAVLDSSMALLTLLWGVSLAIALVAILVVSLARWTSGKGSLRIHGRVLLITAHPDDECMFFAPAIVTLTQAGVEIFLLCLSEGHLYHCKYTTIEYTCSRTVTLVHLARGGITPIGAVSRAATGVKMQSNGQGTFGGLVKQSSGVLGPISSIARRPRGVVKILRMRSQSMINGSRAKIHRGQVVKAIFKRSKILTPVAALDTVPMGVTSP